MKSLNEDLKTGKFKQIYLLYGSEGYLKKQYKERFIKAMLPEGDTMNYAYYEGKGTDIKEVIDLSETLPFFAPRRLVVFENTGFFKSGGNDLADYVRELPETTFYIFIESEIDKRSRLYKTVKTKGHIVELATQDENTLKRWIQSILKKEGKSMADADILYFLNKVGTDMENIQKELEKLVCYALERQTLGREDVDAVCVTQISNHIFDMVSAVSEKNQRHALDLYYELLALKEPPMRILFLIARQFNQLLLVKSLAAKGMDRSSIASKAQVAPFIAGRLMTQARSFTLEQLKNAVKDCVDAEEAVKTGRMTDILSVELLIVKYSAGILKK